MNICTSVAKNYLPHARVMAESFKEHHPGGTCYVLIVDETEGYVDLDSEPFEIVTPADLLDAEDLNHRVEIYSVYEFSMSMKPQLLSHLLNERGLERVAFVDPDIRLYDRLDRLEGLAREYELVLSPQTTSPIPRDGKEPSDEHVLLTGTYNAGLIAVERSPNTNGLLDWWSERLKTGSVVEPDRGYFGDQRWMDLFPCLVPSCYILRDPGYNVANWNLHYRNLTIEGDRYYVNGEPLQSFHFSHFNPDRPHLFSTYQDRIRPHRGSALARICEEYADALIIHGYHEAKNWPYTYGTLPNGLELDRFMRRLYRAGLESGELEGSIFTPEGAQRFTTWLEEPAPVGGKHGITRYLYALYTGRPKLWRKFPSLDGPEGAAFVKWAFHRGFSGTRHAYVSAPTVAPSKPSPLGRVASFARRVFLK